MNKVRPRGQQSSSSHQKKVIGIESKRKRIFHGQFREEISNEQAGLGIAKLNQVSSAAKVYPSIPASGKIKRTAANIKK